MKKIRELGSLPADAFEKYQKTGVKVVSIKKRNFTFKLVFVMPNSLLKSERSCPQSLPD